MIFIVNLILVSDTLVVYTVYSILVLRPLMVSALAGTAIAPDKPVTIAPTARTAAAFEKIFFFILMNPFLILFLEKRLSLSLVYTMIFEKSIEKEEFDKIS